MLRLSQVFSKIGDVLSTPLSLFRYVKYKLGFYTLSDVILAQDTQALEFILRYNTIDLNQPDYYYGHFDHTQKECFLGDRLPLNLALSATFPSEKIVNLLLQYGANPHVTLEDFIHVFTKKYAQQSGLGNTTKTNELAVTTPQHAQKKPILRPGVYRFYQRELHLTAIDLCRDKITYFNDCILNQDAIHNDVIIYRSFAQWLTILLSELVAINPLKLTRVETSTSVEAETPNAASPTAANLLVPRHRKKVRFSIDEQPPVPSVESNGKEIKYAVTMCSPG